MIDLNKLGHQISGKLYFMNDYLFDIYISYTRDKEVISWLSDHFIPILKHKVKYELRKEVNVFFDENYLGVSDQIDDKLKNYLTRSKTIIPLWTANYLDSKYCSIELSYFLERMKLINKNLLIPIIAHDGYILKSHFNNIIHLDISDCFNSRMSPYGTLAERLAELLKKNARNIAECISYAPPFAIQWQNINIDESINLLKNLNDQNPTISDLPFF